MSWNYRILNHGEHFALHEVYYDKDANVTGWTESAVDFSCDIEEGPGGIIGSLRRALVGAESGEVLDAREAAPKPPAGTPAAPCPFCEGPALACETFPKFDHPWFVHVKHLPDCELRSADGARQCHATEAGALASWNRRAVAVTVAATSGDSPPVPAIKAGKSVDFA